MQKQLCFAVLEKGGHIADKSSPGLNFNFIADADTIGDQHNFHSGQSVLGNFMCFCVYKREILRESILNHLAKVTLPESGAT